MACLSSDDMRTFLGGQESGQQSLGIVLGAGCRPVRRWVWFTLREFDVGAVVGRGDVGVVGGGGHFFWVAGSASGRWRWWGVPSDLFVVGCGGVEVLVWEMRREGQRD